MKTNNSRRDIKKIRSLIDKQVDMAGFSAAPRQWLAAYANQHGCQFLLAHADDGVIWGRLAEDALLLSSDDEVFGDKRISPALRDITLQQVRLFGDACELLVWRDGGGAWKGRLIVDGEGAKIEYFDEPQILWGTKLIGSPKNGFSLVEEGMRGYRHAVPLEAQAADFPPDDTSYNPLRLLMRHYLGEDEASGQLKVLLSRLVRVQKEEVHP